MGWALARGLERLGTAGLWEAKSSESVTSGPLAVAGTTDSGEQPVRRVRVGKRLVCLCLVERPLLWEALTGKTKVDTWA